MVAKAKKRFLVLGGENYATPLRDAYPKCVVTLLDTNQEVGFENYKKTWDAVLFTGGADVNPALYGEKPHPLTSSHPVRDNLELEIYKYCVEKYIPMLGICRGSQFLWVALGGKLNQHIEGHAIQNMHNAWANGQYVSLRAAPDLPYAPPFKVTSTHHQSVRWDTMPENKKVYTKLLLVGEGRDKEKTTAVESWYADFLHAYPSGDRPRSRILGMQFHPEYMTKGSLGRKFAADAVRWSQRDLDTKTFYIKD